MFIDCSPCARTVCGIRNTVWTNKYIIVSAIVFTICLGLETLKQLILLIKVQFHCGFRALQERGMVLCSMTKVLTGIGMVRKVYLRSYP